MALVKCPECGKEVSNLAKACPSCGGPVTLTPAGSAALSDGKSAPSPPGGSPQPKPSWIVILGGGFLAVMTLMAILGSIFKPGGAPADTTHPFETRLVSSQGNGGWMLFDSVEVSFERGRSVALEEECQVKVTGPVERGPRRPGQTMDSAANPPVCPVMVISGRYAGKTGWTFPGAIGR